MSHTKPSVAIIVPTIGRPKYMGSTIKSLLRQDYENFQIKIFDNAPSAASHEVLSNEGIFDSRISILTRPRRLPFSEHMNLCLSDTTAEYVMILSDDDQLAPGYISEMVNLASRNEGVSVCLGRQVKISERDTGLVSIPSQAGPAMIIDGIEYIERSLAGELNTGIMTYISLFARRADIDSVGGFRNYPDGSHADNLIMMSLATRGRVAISSSIMLYRVYSTSAGLSTPFQALLEATKAYTRDFSRAIASCSRVELKQREHLEGLLRRSNIFMLLNRMRHVYSSKLSVFALLACLFETVRFAVTPIRHL